MASLDLAGLVRERILDSEGAALAWLLLEGGVPLVVAGSAPAATRVDIAVALLGAEPDRAWLVLDADEDPPTTERLGAIIAGGVSLGLTVGVRDLRTLLDSLTTTAGLPEDAVRRLGLVAIVEATPVGPRIVALHYLRPTERDAQGHVQRRPPAVLVTWDPELDTFEHFAWGVTPELGDRVDRSQADLEERQRDRAAFIDVAARDGTAWMRSAPGYLAREPDRVPAPAHEPATPSPFGSGLTDPDPLVH